jgi:hypothetical protein
MLHIKKNRIIMENLEQLGTLRKEQWKQLERSHRRKKQPREDETKRSSWKKKRQYACRLFRMNILKEGAM